MKTLVCSFETFVHVMSSGAYRWVCDNGVSGVSPNGDRLVHDKFCPTWGPRPSWWRRWFLREKPHRVLYEMSDT